MADQEFTTQELNPEEWRDVVGFEGRYCVSESGRLMRRQSKYHVQRATLEKASSIDRGYRRITLGNSKKDRKTVTIHTLVAAAFLGPRPTGTQINHKDGDKLNNHYSNLEYVTPAENFRHAYTHGLVVAPMPTRGEERPSAKLTDANVRQIREMYACGHKKAEIARRFGICPSTAARIINRVKWRHVD